MPGSDGMGPNGQGPMTGGARGVCNPRYARYRRPYRMFRGVLGRPRWGLGRGVWGWRAFGRGFFGRGRRRRW